MHIQLTSASLRYCGRPQLPHLRRGLRAHHSSAHGALQRLQSSILAAEKSNAGARARLAPTAPCASRTGSRAACTARPAHARSALSSGKGIIGLEGTSLASWRGGGEAGGIAGDGEQRGCRVDVGGDSRAAASAAPHDIATSDDWTASCAPLPPAKSMAPSLPSSGGTCA